MSPGMGFETLSDKDLQFIEASWVNDPVDPNTAMMTLIGYICLATWELNGDAIQFYWHAEIGEVVLILRSAHPKPFAVVLKGEDELNVLIPIDWCDRLLIGWGMGPKDLIDAAVSLRDAAEVLEA